MGFIVAINGLHIGAFILGAVAGYFLIPWLMRTMGGRAG